jgi:hypothetical protein
VKSVKARTGWACKEQKSVVRTQKSVEKLLF